MTAACPGPAPVGAAPRGSASVAARPTVCPVARARSCRASHPRRARSRSPSARAAASPASSQRRVASPIRPRLSTPPDPSRRSYRPRPALLRDVVRRAPRERENRPRGVLVGLRDERPAIGDEEVLAVMRLAVRVERRRLRIAAHPDPAQLVNDAPAGRDPVALLLRRHLRERRASHLGDERAEGLLHVLHLIELVIGPLPVEAKHGDPPSVDHVRIDLGIALVVGDLLASPGETDRRTVVAAVILL